MSKKKSSKTWYNMLGTAVMAVIGFVFGLALFLVLYGWYLAGFADSYTVLTTAVILIILMYVTLIIAYWIGKSYGLSYEKAIWLGIGFTIALLIMSIILGYLGLETSVSVSTLVYVAKERLRIA